MSRCAATTATSRRSIRSAGSTPGTAPSTVSATGRPIGKVMRTSVPSSSSISRLVAIPSIIDRPVAAALAEPAHLGGHPDAVVAHGHDQARLLRANQNPDLSVALAVGVLHRIGERLGHGQLGVLERVEVGVHGLADRAQGLPDDRQAVLGGRDAEGEVGSYQADLDVDHGVSITW